ncbi:MAG: hypothetical protein ACRDQY_04130 [Pseudonocardiaceae bacterium]
MNHHDPILVNPPGADPDRPVGVAACELQAWATLISRLAHWLDHAPDATARDLHRHFAGSPDLQGMTCFLEYIADRIDRLLHPDRGLRADQGPR